MDLFVYLGALPCAFGSHSYQEYTGTSQDTLLRSSRFRSRFTVVLNKVRERKSPILWGQLPQLYRVSPVPSCALTLLLCGYSLVTHLSLGPLKDTVGSSLG